MLKLAICKSFKFGVMSKDTFLLIFNALANADVQFPWEQSGAKAAG